MYKFLFYPTGTNYDIPHKHLRCEETLPLRRLNKGVMSKEDALKRDMKFKELMRDNEIVWSGFVAESALKGNT